MGTTHRYAAALLASILLFAGHASAQQSSSIAGAVIDSTGAAMPGVTVEASSPALIEGVRSAITDGQGRYNIVDLRPGTYAVTFSLTGFKQRRQEGIQLTAGFTATVNASIEVGAFEETVTVTGATPLVDTQRVQQQDVLSDELLRELPSSTRAPSTFSALIPGMNGVADVGGSGGIQNSNAVWRGRYHGKSGINHLHDGTSFETQVNSVSFIANPYNVQEVQVATGGVSADTDSQGVVINMIPKDGGNSFSTYVYGVFGNDALQANNLDAELIARGVTTTNSAIYVYDTAVSVGGPFKKDRLWFYATGRMADGKIQVPGVYFNATQGTPFYTPNLEEPAYRREYLRSGALRLSWQASEKNRVTSYTETQTMAKRGDGSFVSPESASAYLFWPEGLYQVNWTSPRTNRLLLEGTFAYSHNPYPYPSPGDSFMKVGENDISILESTTGFRYNAKLTYDDPWLNNRYVQRFALSHVTGSHAFKTGVQVQEGKEDRATATHGDVAYTFTRGVPSSITQYATPYELHQNVKADLGLYAQDQWTLKRLTLNLGLRFDYWNGEVPAQHIPATQFLPERSYAAVKDVPEFMDFNPRLGAAYDLFGDGRTALKFSVARYVRKASITLPSQVNPINTSVNSVTRVWTDNGNFIPDCDLTNPNANGECLAINNFAFGQQVITTRYEDDVLRGFGARNSMWDMAAEFQHQLRPGVSVSGGYYRNWAAHFEARDNLLVTPADFDWYCITAPSDPRLPNGGGYPVCGLYDVAPAMFGLSDTRVSQASNFFGEGSKANCGVATTFNAGQISRNMGAMCGVSDFLGAGFDARLAHGIQFGGGIDTGRTVLDNCYVIDSPQQLLNCRGVVPWGPQTQIKLHGSYQFPWEVLVSGIFQNVGGPEVEAIYQAANAEIAPSLGRSLAACRGATTTCNATAAVPLVAPLTMWEERRTQVDLRLSKRFAIGQRGHVKANVDIYNVFNDNSVLGLNQNYGAQWLRPIAFISQEAFLQGRFIQFSGEWSF